MRSKNHSFILRAVRYICLLFLIGGGFVTIISTGDGIDVIRDVSMPDPDEEDAKDNSGRAVAVAAEEGTLKWAFPAGTLATSPAIAPDGTIYVASHDSNVYAVYPNGTLRWAFPTGGRTRSSPAVGPDGTIYAGSEDRKLYAINPNGTQEWAFSTGGWVVSSPAVGPDGTIYVGSHDGYLYAVNPDGTRKWAFKTLGGFQRDWVVSSPAVDCDGTIYVGSEDHRLYAINPKDGSQKWAFLTGAAVSSSPAIDADGTIYVESFDGYFYAINPDGSQKWTIRVGDGGHSCPAIGPDGTIYVGSYYDGKLYAISPSGNQQWVFPLGGQAASAAVGSDGIIYVGSKGGTFYAINPDGSERWSFSSGWVYQTSPVVDSDGTIYVGSSSHKSLYAINSGSKGLADSAWPVFHHDIRHTALNCFEIVAVEIDIKPGSHPNGIDLKSEGVLAVAVLTGDKFDAYNIDPGTCVFAGAEPEGWTMEDVDDDGDYDMLFHWRTQDLDLSKNSKEATLTGFTVDGMEIVGTDSVSIVLKK
jgi:outer membrane protein assembly factor BamB